MATYVTTTKLMPSLTASKSYVDILSTLLMKIALFQLLTVVARSHAKTTPLKPSTRLQDRLLEFGRRVHKTIATIMVSVLGCSISPT